MFAKHSTHPISHTFKSHTRYQSASRWCIPRSHNKTICLQSDTHIPLDISVSPFCFRRAPTQVEAPRVQQTSNPNSDTQSFKHAPLHAYRGLSCYSYLPYLLTVWLALRLVLLTDSTWRTFALVIFLSVPLDWHWSDAEKVFGALSGGHTDTVNLYSIHPPRECLY